MINLLRYFEQWIISINVWQRWWNALYLWNGTKIEDALVAQPRQVGDDVGDVVQSIGDQQVETRQSRLQFLGVSKILKSTGELAPSLNRHTAGLRLNRVQRQVRRTNTVALKGLPLVAKRYDLVVCLPDSLGWCWSSGGTDPWSSPAQCPVPLRGPPAGRRRTASTDQRQPDRRRSGSTAQTADGKHRTKHWLNIYTTLAETCLIYACRTWRRIYSVARQR